MSAIQQMLAAFYATQYIPTPVATPPAFGNAFEGGFYAGMIWNELVQTGTSSIIGTGTKTFDVSISGPIVYIGQSLEVRSRANPANKMVGTVASATVSSITISVASVGGSGTFTDWSIMAKYRVIVAPKATGESSALSYKSTDTAAPNACQTLSEGRNATLAMVAAGDSTVYPAAHFCNNLSIAGKADWYLPSRDEFELCIRNLKPVTESNYTTADRFNSTFNYANLGAFDDAVTTHGTNNNSSPVGAAYTAGIPAQVAAGKGFRTGESDVFPFANFTKFITASESSSTSCWGWEMNTGSYGAASSLTKVSAGVVYVTRAVRRSII